MLHHFQQKKNKALLSMKSFVLLKLTKLCKILKLLATVGINLKYKKGLNASDLIRNDLNKISNLNKLDFEAEQKRFILVFIYDKLKHAHILRLFKS